MYQAPYRAAVIGYTGHGNYGHDIDLAFLEQPKLKLVAVADANPIGLALASRRLGVNATYADYRQMLDREKPEFVAVAPRWIDARREMILACAERGIHVFCEKPMAPTLADCDAIVTACERSHTKLAIAFQTRYSPKLARIREMIDAGVIGEVLEVRGRGKEDNRGGGEDLMVLGTHVMDMFRALLGDASWCYSRVLTEGRPVTPKDARNGAEGLGLLAGDRIDATYGFAQKSALAHFGTTRQRQTPGRFGVQIFGTSGRIDLGFGWLPSAHLLTDPTWTGHSAQANWVEITSAGVGKPETLSSNSLLDANRVIVADLIQAVETDTQPKASVYDGRAAVEMILACYDSHLRGTPVSIPLTDRAKHPLETVAEARKP
ncbi:Gfo/Idh/MocA family protein [Singulisphaera sp. PoT]|uniref:Gfo/Idh/MocA family protein n=1 Tax=Singulisphaera sp. PoT TaxID=3411797 RepID=UPI003BF5333F